MNRPHSHAVVTGASSGIGRATAVQLARAGYHLFAGVRKSADGIALRQAAQQQAAAGELTPLPLGVTSATQIAAYAELLPATMHRAELVQDPFAGAAEFDFLFLPWWKYLSKAIRQSALSLGAHGLPAA